MPPLTAVDQIILRRLHLQGIHVVFGIYLSRIEQELVGRNGKQGLGHFPDVGKQEVLNILGGKNHGGLLLPDTFHVVADVLNGHRAVQEQVQFVQSSHTVSNAEKLVGHVGQNIELNGAAELLVQIHNALYPKHQEHIILDIGMPIEEPALRTDTDGIQPQTDITQSLLGIEELVLLVIAVIFL